MLRLECRLQLSLPPQVHLQLLQLESIPPIMDVRLFALVNADNGEHIFTELLHVHDGTDINLVEFGSVASNSLVPYNATGIGTFKR